MHSDELRRLPETLLDQFDRSLADQDRQLFVVLAREKRTADASHGVDDPRHGAGLEGQSSNTTERAEHESDCEDHHRATSRASRPPLTAVSAPPPKAIRTSYSQVCLRGNCFREFFTPPPAVEIRIFA